VSEISAHCFHDFMSSSSGSVLSIKIVRKLENLFSTWFRIKIPIHIIFFLLTGLPFWVNFIFHPFNLSCTGEAVSWLVYYTVPNYFLFWFPQIAWQGLVDISDSIDETVKSVEDKRSLISWMKKRLTLKLQCVLSLLGGIIGIFVLNLFEPLITQRVEVCIASYISVFCTAVLGSNAIYWLWSVPFFIRLLYRIPRLHVTWNYPARTPAIKNLSRLLGISALFTAIGAFLFLSPLLYILSWTQPTEIVLFVSLWAPLVSLSTVGFVAIFPQYWLSVIVRREKNIILDHLSKEIEDLRIRSTSSDALLALEAKVSIYRAIDASSNATVNMSILMNYLFALLMTLLPYLFRLT
jgi:hypothetical protein